MFLDLFRGCLLGYFISIFFVFVNSFDFRFWLLVSRVEVFSFSYFSFSFRSRSFIMGVFFSLKGLFSCYVVVGVIWRRK